MTSAFAPARLVTCEALQCLTIRGEGEVSIFSRIQSQLHVKGMTLILKQLKNLSEHMEKWPIHRQSSCFFFSN